jgi:Type VIII secretion system (T8SS), CsgF protein
MRKILVSVGLMLSATVAQAELVHQFKNPAFSGIGFSSHVLTIDSIEKSRRDAIEADKKATIAKAEAELLNTPLNRFMGLFQSQVYAQLATQLSNNLFTNKCAAADGTTIPGCVNPTTGNFALDGNTVTWAKANDKVTLTVVDAKGTVTKVIVPIASFSF